MFIASSLVVSRTDDTRWMPACSRRRRSAASPGNSATPSSRIGSSASSLRSMAWTSTPFRLKARAAAWPTFPAPMISTGGGGWRSPGINALSAAICESVPASTMTPSGWISGIGKRGPQLSALPETDHAETGPFPKAGVADRLAGEDRVARGKLGDLQPVIGADHVRIAAGVGAVGEILAELVLERQHGRRAAQLQHVDRVLLLDHRHDRQVGSNLAGGDRDVGVGRVFAVGQQHAGAVRVRPLVGGAAVVVAGDRP